MVNDMEFPKKKYNTIVIDPPWDITMSGKVKRRPNRARRLPYDTMSLDEIKKIPISQIANVGCHVYCWTTNKTLRQAFDVLQSWGVNFHLTLVWVKPSSIAPCFAYNFATEFCLLGFYGKPMQKFSGKVRLNWLQAFTKKGQHSRKPNVFRALFEEMSPSPRIELFARERYEGWDAWGDEVSNEIQQSLRRGDGV